MVIAGAMWGWEPERILAFTLLALAFSLLQLIAIWLAFGPYALWLRFGLTLFAIACIEISVILVFTGGRIHQADLPDLAGGMLAFSYYVMVGGFFLSMARLAGWNLQRIGVLANKNSQFSISHLLQLTAICAIALSSTTWVDSENLSFPQLKMVTASMIGQLSGVLLLLVEPINWIKRLAGLLLVATTTSGLIWLLAEGIFMAITDRDAFVFVGELSFFSFNFLALACFVLRALGYRLVRQTAAVKI